MRQAEIVFQQVLMIFVYVALGVFSRKKEILTKESGESLSRFALMIISPCLIVGSYIRPYEPQMAKGIILAFFLAVVYHGAATFLAVLMIPAKDDQRYRVERLGTIFSNCGYMAIPMIQAAVGSEGVFYAVPFISVFTILLWSEGVVFMKDRGSVKVKNMFINPGFLSFIIGLIIYFLRIPVPGLMEQTLNTITALNTPLTMITVGCFLAEVSVGKLLANGRLYYLALLRLVIFPLGFIMLMYLFRVENWLECASKVEWALMLACACSAPASTTQFPAMYGRDSVYGAQIIAVTVFFSIFTIPVLTILCQKLF